MAIAGATYREGIAYSPDGAMYVTLDPSGAYTGTTITATTKFLAADGTGAAPTYSFTSTTNQGLYRASATALGLAAGGVPVAFIDATAGYYSVLPISWTSSLGSAVDAHIARVSANVLRFGGAAGVTTTSRTEINKAVAAIANTVATTVLTVTIPNAAHNATLEVRVMGALGAGGAIGAGEAMATNTYIIGIVRTAGLATVATATAAFGAVAVAVAGAATVTATAAVSAIAGANGATQTFTVDVTITRSTGSSDNHTCLCYGKLLNANSTGITIS